MGQSDIMYFPMWYTEKDTNHHCSIPAKNAWSEFGHEESIRHISCKTTGLDLQEGQCQKRKKKISLKENRVQSKMSYWLLDGG